MPASLQLPDNHQKVGAIKAGLLHVQGSTTKEILSPQRTTIVRVPNEPNDSGGREMKTKISPNASTDTKELARRLINLLQNKNNGFDAIENRPVSIPPATIRKITQAKHIQNPTMAIGIYTFMYARAREEKTNRPWVNNEYIAKGLKLNPQTVAKYRKQLTELGLIQDIPLRKDGRIYKHVTHIRYYDGITIRDPQLIEFITTLCKSYPIGKVQCSSTVVSACSLPSEEENAYSVCCGDRSGHAQRPPKSLNLSNGKAKSSPGHRLAVQLFQGVRKHVEHGPNHLPKLNKETGKRDYRNWDSTFNQFLRQYPKITEQEMSEVMAWYIPHIGRPFVPEVYAARTFCEKFLDIQRAKKRVEQDVQRKQNKRERLDDGTWTDGGDDHWESFPCTPEEAEQLRQEEAEYNRRMGVG